MSEIIFTKEKLHEMHNHYVTTCKHIENAVREKKVKETVYMFTRHIIRVNHEGQKNTYSYYCYNYDTNFVSDIANGMRERFPDSTIVMNNSTIVGRIAQSLFNYTLITVSWK